MDCIKQWCNGKDDCPCPMCRGTVQPEEMFSFEERLSSYKEICDKEKRELELFTQQEVEDLEDKLIALELQRNTQVTNLQAQYTALVNRYNAEDARRVAEYDALVVKYNANNAIDKERIAQYNALSDSFNALRAQYIASQNR